MAMPSMRCPALTLSRRPAAISGCRRSRSGCSAVAGPSRGQLTPEHHEHQQQQQHHPQQPLTLAQVVAKPSTGLLALTGFVLVASSVSQPGPGSLPAAALRQLLSGSPAAAAAASPAATAADAGDPLQPSSLLLQLDAAVHGYVAAHTTEGFRLMADAAISDAAITAGIAGWLWATAACLTRAPARSAGVLALAWAAYYASCGAVGHGDPPLVDLLKHLFGRARPSDLHHSFSFPSGHTSAAVFIVGAFLVVLLPLARQLLAEREAPGSAAGGDGAAAQAAGRSSRGGSGIEDGAMLALWGAAWVTTATGRVLADAHWVSDTLGGGLLAVAAVSSLAWSSSWMLEHSGGGGGSGSGGASSGGTASAEQPSGDVGPRGAGGGGGTGTAPFTERP